MITQHFILHMVPDTVRPKIYLSQRSTGLEKLQFTLVGTNGAYYSIPSGTSITLVGSKPDKKGFSYACTYSGSTVTCDVTDQMTAVAGLVTAELRFANNSGAVIPSQNMDIIVERSPLDGTFCSKNDFISVEEEIQSISQDVTNAKRYAEQAAAAGTAAVANINETASTATSTINTAVSTATSTIDSAVSAAETSITSTKDSAIAAVESSETTVLQEFEDTKAYIQEYGTSGVTMEYDDNTQSFRIASVTN